MSTGAKCLVTHVNTDVMTVIIDMGILDMMQIRGGGGGEIPNIISQ